MNLRTSLVAIATAAAISVALLATFALPGGVSPARADQPVITFQFPEEGAVLKERPRILQMCFKEPIDVRDLPPLNEGDFHFALTPPGNTGGLGMRIVFQPDGYGVAIYSGNPASEPPEGEWTWEYRVVDRETGDPLEGTVHFTTNAATGQEVIQNTPPACLAEGATNQPTGQVVGTDRASETPTGSSSSGGDDDPGVLTLALITIGIAAAGALVAVVAFLIRRRAGYEPHAPSDEEGKTGDDQH